MTNSDVDGIETYDYQGIELTPGIISELAWELFAGQIVRRSDMITRIPAEHESRGGLPSKVNTTSQMKKALQYLVSRGLATSTGAYGLWRFAEGDADQSAAVEQVSEFDTDENSSPIVVEEWFGDGSELTYVYSFPSLKLLADFRQESVWPLKIGMTRIPNLDRILQQLGTSSFEWPVVHLAIRCDDARLVEKSLQTVLTLRGEHIIDVPGTEWFLTSPRWIKDFLLTQARHVLGAAPIQDGPEEVGVV
jgi:hypothetical protein